MPLSVEEALALKPGTLVLTSRGYGVVVPSTGECFEGPRVEVRLEGQPEGESYFMEPSQVYEAFNEEGESLTVRSGARA